MSAYRLILEFDLHVEMLEKGAFLIVSVCVCVFVCLIQSVGKRLSFLLVNRIVTVWRWMRHYTNWMGSYGTQFSV